MKKRRSTSPILPRLLAAGLGFLPMLAAAHPGLPGHYHPPGEEDEFDALSSGMMHLPAWQSMALAALTLGVILYMLRKRIATPAL